MAPKTYERKLTAILSADVAGFSRLMGEDDEATVSTLTGHRKMMVSLIDTREKMNTARPAPPVLKQ